MILDGTWLPENAELAGRRIPMPPTRFVISGANYVVVSAESRDTGVLIFAADGLEVALDIVGTAGPNAGRTIPAIWRVEDDVLELCYDIGGGERPMNFSTARDGARLLVRYRRET